LWVALVSARPSPLLRNARSTVLVVYGALAVTAMFLRVAAERGAPVDLLWYRSFPEYAGPLLLAAALVLAAWYTRSLLPSAMAAAILVILCPELRANFQATFPGLGWGTGFGSAWTALAMVAAAFALRGRPELRDLEGGDLFLGREPFPLRRRDHSLFTIPLLVSALYLAARVDTWTWVRHLPQVPLKTAAALIVTAVVWTLLGVYFRASRAARLFVHLGWMCLLLGILFGFDRLAPEAEAQWALLATLLALQLLELFYRYVLAPRHPWATALLADRTSRVLRVGSLVLALVYTFALWGGMPAREADVLAAFLALELARQGLERDTRLDGGVLVALLYTLLLAATAPGAGVLGERLSRERSLVPTLLAVVGVQLAHVLLELV